MSEFDDVVGTTFARSLLSSQTDDGGFGRALGSLNVFWGALLGGLVLGLGGTWGWLVAAAVLAISVAWNVYRSPDVRDACALFVRSLFSAESSEDRIIRAMDELAFPNWRELLVERAEAYEEEQGRPVSAARAAEERGTLSVDPRSDEELKDSIRADSVITMGAPDDPTMLVAWVDVAPNFAVAGWLQSSGQGDSGGRWEAEWAAFHREDPLVDLALARYGVNDELMPALWNRSPALRRAILLNEQVGGPPDRDSWLSWIGSAPPDEIDLYATSQARSRSMLRSIYRREREFTEISDERWYAIGLAALCHPQLRDHPILMPAPEDGWEYHERVSLTEEIFAFLLVLPPTGDNARSLLDALSNVVRLGIPRPEDGKRDDQHEIEVLGRLFGRWSSNAQDPTITGLYGKVRRLIASKIESQNDWMMSHADREVRVGGSARADFSDPEELREFVEAEGVRDCMELMTWNPSIRSMEREDVAIQARTLYMAARRSIELDSSRDYFVQKAKVWQFDREWEEASRMLRGYGSWYYSWEDWRSGSWDRAWLPEQEEASEPEMLESLGGQIRTLTRTIIGLGIALVLVALLAAAALRSA